jgi:Zn-finger nucleic acid-binding protein
MNCPVCGTELRTIQYEGVSIEECEACEGRWLEAGKLKEIIDARDVQFGAADRQAAAKGLRNPGVPPKEIERPIPCPNCRVPTAAINYGQDTGIIINRCSTCGGTWLDRGELEKIQLLLEGLDDNIMGP